MQELYGIRAGLADYARANLADYDGVLVCTPSNQHVPQATRAAQAGCHLFVEKPISTTMDGVDDLIALCHESHLILQVGYVYRHHPLFAEMQEVLASGDLGPIHMALLKVGYPVDRARPDFRSTYWVQAATGGGVFHDASHCLDFIQELLSPITAVTAQARHYEFEVDPEVEDAAVALFEFESGALGSATFNHFQRNRTSRVELVGARGTILWEIEKHQLVVYRDADRSWQRHRFELEPDDMYLNQMRSFLGALAGRNEPLVTGEDGRRTLLVVLACLQSARDGARTATPPG